MGDGGPAPPAFDAVLLVHPASEAAVGGLRLVERAAFTFARAGARRLSCVGSRPTARLRLPDIPIVWLAPADAPTMPTSSPDAAPFLVLMDAAAVADPTTVIALAEEARDSLRRRDDVLLAATAPALLWACPGRVFAAVLPHALAESATTPHDVPASRTGAGPPRVVAATTVLPWRPPEDGLLLRAHDASGRAAAARALFARLGRAGDGWFTRAVDRRISRVLTRLLLPTGVTPNQVTFASIAVGIAAGGLFAMGAPGAALAGAVLFLFSTIVDGCDGELARLTFRESAFGARLDIVGDNVVHVFLFGGIAAGLYRQTHETRIALLGTLLVAGVLAAMAAVWLCLVRQAPTPRQRALFEAFASREFAYLLVVLTLAGKLEWFLWLSVAGTYVFVAALLALRR